MRRQAEHHSIGPVEHERTTDFPLSLYGTVRQARPQPEVSRSELMAQLMPLVVALCVLVTLNLVGVWLMNGARAFVSGESLWSKSRQQAAQHLDEYLADGNARSLALFDLALRIPLGDRRAREAMLADPPDERAAWEGLVQGGNSPDDIPAMLWILDHLKWERDVAAALQAWRQGDEQIEQLRRLARTAARPAPELSPPEGWLSDQRAQLRAINSRLINLELAFSDHVANATRRVAATVELLNATMAAVLLGAGAVLTYRMIRRRQGAESRAQVYRERLELATKGANDGIWDWHVLGHGIFWTPRTRELLGFPDDASFARYQVREEVHPEDRPRLSAALRAHFAGEDDRLDINLRLRRLDGVHRWFQLRGMAIRDASGLPVRMLGTVSDIHERVIGNLALQEAWIHSQRVADELELALDGANVALWAYDPRTDTILHHRRWKALLGRERMPEHFDGWIELTHPDDREQRLTKLREHLDNLSPYYESEFRMRHADGRWVWVRSRGRATVRDGDGRAQLYAGAVMNISDQVAAREIERREQRFLRTVIEGVDVGVLVSDAQHVVYTNSALRLMLGFRRADDLAGAELTRVLPDSEIHSMAARRDVGRIGLGAPMRVVRMRSASGAQVPVITHLSAVDWNGRRLFISTCTGMSDTAVLEHQLRAMSDRFERALMTEIEGQQAHIARELHDSLGSMLAGVSLLMGNARSTGVGAGAALLLDRAQDELGRAADMIRALARGIMPVTAHPGALGQAIEQFASDLSAFKQVACSARLEGPVDDIPVRVANQLFRIIQEAVTNSITHGHASTVDVELEVAAGELLLVIEDDGTGFDPAGRAEAAEGLGLRSMRARAHDIGASLNIVSAAGGGCRLVLSGPVRMGPAPVASVMGSPEL